MDATLSSTALIPIEHQVDLVRLFQFYNLKNLMEVRRARFFKLYESSMAVAASYLDALPEAETIIRLRREIRINTRGAPQLYAEDAVSSAGYLSAGTEQLYNAQSHLVKNMYRKIAPLVHPDRGGDQGLFQQALAAYKMNDLTFLQDLWWKLTRDNVFWRSSEAALDYMRQEIERPEVSLVRLRVRPEFQIVMLHQSGKPDRAREFAALHAKRLVLRLQQELDRMLYRPDLKDQQPNVGESHGNKENGGQGHQEDRNDKDFGEGWSGQ